MSKSKVVPINKKALRKSHTDDEYDFETQSRKFDECFHDPDQQHKIFTELGFSYHEDEEMCFACDRNGSCPEHPQDKGLYINGRLNLEGYPALKKIRIVVALEEIAMAMEDQNNDIESHYYLDIETGEVEFYTSDVFGTWEENDPAEIESLPDWQKDEIVRVKEIQENEDRYVAIPRLESSVGFRFMEDFVDEVKDEKVANKLIRALRQNKPFRRFKDALEDVDLLDRWFQFKNRKMRKEVADFLESIDHKRIELAVPPMVWS